MYYLTTQSSKGACSQAYESAPVGVLLIKKQTEKKRVSNHEVYIVGLTA